MPTTMLANSITALAAAGVALASAVGFLPKGAYEDGALTRLSKAEMTAVAEQIFSRADRNADEGLDVDEFAALSVVTAELAHLNGFISVEQDDALKTVALPVDAPAALPASEHVRIDAVARHAFYTFAGKDQRMNASEYVRMQNAIFEAADLNASGALTRRELDIYAQRQAYFSTGA